MFVNLAFQHAMRMRHTYCTAVLSSVACPDSTVFFHSIS